MISVGTKADITGYQQLWEHFSQLSDSQDGWIIWDICRSPSSILVEKGEGRKKEKGERERRKRRVREKKLRGGKERCMARLYKLYYILALAG